MLGRTLQLGRTNFEWLSRRLSLAGLLSRREAEKAIAAGQVTVNGETIRNNVEVCSEATVCYKGAVVPPPVATPQLFGLVKPRRVLCVLEERGDVPTLHTLMRHLYVEQELLPDEAEDLQRQTQGRPLRTRVVHVSSTWASSTPARSNYLNGANVFDAGDELYGDVEESEDEDSSPVAQNRARDRRRLRSATSERSSDTDCGRAGNEPGASHMRARETIESATSMTYANSLDEFVDRRFRMSTRLQHDTQPVLAELPRHLIVVRPLPIEADGFVLLTNDGDFAHAVQKPENRVQSVFDVRVSGTLPSYRLLESWRCGVSFGSFDFGPVWVELLTARRNAAWLRLHLVERPGMDLRLLLSSVGLKLRRLRRYAIGPYRASAVPQHTVIPLKFHSSFSRLLPVHKQLQHHAAAAAEARIRAGCWGAAAADAAAARDAARVERGSEASEAAAPHIYPSRRLAIFPAAGEFKDLLEQNEGAGNDHVGGWCIFHEVKKQSVLAPRPHENGSSWHAQTPRQAQMATEPAVPGRMTASQASVMDCEARGSCGNVSRGVARREERRTSGSPAGGLQEDAQLSGCDVQGGNHGLLRGESWSQAAKPAPRSRGDDVDKTMEAGHEITGQQGSADGDPVASSGALAGAEPLSLDREMQDLKVSF
ncbi:hypothetical protein BESB_025340 [Besnoitia besnoiti]|uniref:RNA-binding S4 domain-containing protein n=1 Tax=Besnoitia besnoiti TaxID=94643 RepID=A0A2A9LYP8_BESBE|nr:uncharacterized protein BESB_025340 [Besnoitia besnoiti]PFH31568.1 hypothetical protein BESB_025340 [Besnoitia besnoiti]